MENPEIVIASIRREMPRNLNEKENLKLITIEHSPENRIVTICASGTLTANDYDAALPELEHAIELADDPLRIMIRLENFSGWEIEAAWKDLKFGLTLGGDLGRVAVVGENKLEEWGTKLSAPFIGAEMKYFSTDQEVAAQSWLEAQD